MTEKRPLREQRANHSYVQLPHVRSQHDENARNTHWQESVLEHVKLQRVVTIPENDPSMAWNSFAQRQEQLRRARSRPPSYVSEARPIVARTYAQTGVRASSGRIRVVQRAQQAQQAEIPPIPTRSGRRELRKGLIWRILSFFAVVVIIVLAVRFAFTSNAFRIEQVNVVGTHNVVLMRNIQRMGMQGQNIFLVNIEGLTAKVDAYPFVASTVISKDWPNRLTVTVIERVPVLLWQTQQGVYSVDSQGVVFASASETAGADHLMTVVDTRNGGKGQVIEPGTRLSRDDIVFAVNVLNALPRVAGITTFKLRYDTTLSGGSYVVESPDGWLAYLGGAHDSNPLNNRLTELQQIVSLVQQQQLTLATVDLRYGLHPVYTLKNA
ncbi:MAG: hypothetical protein NVS4B12_04710 [Ktedonobacteraceae bacterium]